MNVIPQLRQGIHGSSLTWCITKAVKFTSRVGQKDRELFHTSEYKTYGKLHCNRAAFHSTSSCRRQSVAIVGSGPAGFYTAQKLLKVLMYSNFIFFIALLVSFFKFFCCCCCFFLLFSRFCTYIFLNPH